MNTITAHTRPAKIAHVAAITPSHLSHYTRMAWDAALAACRETQVAAHPAEDDGDGDVTEAGVEFSRAIDRLVVTPAPDRAALLVKLEFLASAYAGFAMETIMLRALCDDGRRLLVEG